MSKRPLDLVSCISAENKRRKKRRLLLAELYLAMVVVVVDYVHKERRPRDLGAFSDEEHMQTFRKYLLKNLYEGSEVTCYDELRLTKRNFHDLCNMLRERCGLRGSVFVDVEEKVAMLLLVLGHGTKMRVLRGTYKRSLETISRLFSAVLSAIISLSGEIIKLPDPSVQPLKITSGSGLSTHLEH